MAKTQVATTTKQETALAKAEDMRMLPMNQQTTSRGFDEFESDDMIVPYAKLMQALSPEVKDRDKEIRDGDIINSISEYVYGTEFKFIPVTFQKRRICWKHRDVGGGMACLSVGGKEPSDGTAKYAPKCAFCPMKEWGINETKKKHAKELGMEDEKEMAKPFCSMNYVFPSIVLGMESRENQLVAISFGRSSFKSGKQFLNLAKSRGGDIFNNVYLLQSVPTKNDKGEFNIFKVGTVDGKLTESEFKELESWYDLITSSNLDIKMEDEDAVYVESEVVDESNNPKSEDPGF